MAQKSGNLMTSWTLALLAVAIFMTGLWIFSILTIKSLWPGQKLEIWPSVVPVILIWAGPVFALLKLRATSSIAAALASMMYALTGGVTLFTPGPLRLFGLVPLLVAVFLYLYSTRTWMLHEAVWFEDAQRKAGMPASS